MTDRGRSLTHASGNSRPQAGVHDRLLSDIEVVHHGG